MGYIDLIPDVFRLTMPDLATGKSYHTQKFNVGNKQCIGVTIKASQALSVAVAYGIATDTAAAAGVDIAASLPYKTSATSFASNTSTEGGTYHEIALPPHARQAQLVISNASGSTVSGAVIDAALRVVAYPAASGSGSSDFASITGWPGSSSQFVHADGSYSPLSAADIPTGIDAAKIGGGAVSNTEFGYLDGVTSAIQTQISSKLTTPAGTTSQVVLGNGTVGSVPNHAASAITTGQLALARGGTNADLSATGGTGQVLKQTSAGGNVTVAALTAGDIPKNLMMRASRITSDQGSLSGAYTQNTVLYNSLDSAEGSSWTLSSGVLTCALAGRWLIVANVCLTGQTELLAAILKGSTTIAQGYLTCTSVTANYQILTVIETFAVSDTLKVTAALNTATSATLPRLASQATNGYANWIQAIYLGA